jgi:hypothetical protein
VHSASSASVGTLPATVLSTPNAVANVGSRMSRSARGSSSCGRGVMLLYLHTQKIDAQQPRRRCRGGEGRATPCAGCVGRVTNPQNTLVSVLARDRVESAYLTYECVRVWVVSKDTGVWTMDTEYVLGSARCYNTQVRPTSRSTCVTDSRSNLISGPLSSPQRTHLITAGDACTSPVHVPKTCAEVK